MKSKLLFVMLLLSTVCFAQNWTVVTATNITDQDQVKLVSGKLCFLATDSTDKPINFQIGGGGQALAVPKCASVTNGALTGTFQVPNPATTVPAGILYRITVEETRGRTLTYSKVTFTGASFNFDDFSPTIGNVPAPANAQLGYSFNIQNPATDITGQIQRAFPQGVRLVRVYCDTDTDSTTIQLDLRSPDTPNTPGTLLLVAPLLCNSLAQNYTLAFTTANVAPHAPVALLINSITGAPAWLRLHIDYQPQ